MIKEPGGTHSYLVQKILNLLPKKTYRKIIVLTGFQMAATFLDIIALVLLGLLSKSGIEYVQGKSVEISLPIFNFEFFNRFSTERQFAFLSVSVVILFVFRTFLALWGNRKILHFLGAQSSLASNEILKRLFQSKPQYVISQKTQELLYGVTAGIDSLVLSYLGSLILFFSELFFLATMICGLLAIQPIAGLCSLLIFGGAGFLIHKSTSNLIKIDSAKSSDLSVAYSQQLLETLHLYREHFLRGTILNATNEVQKLRRRYLEIRANLMFLPIFSKYLFEFVLILGGASVAAIQFLITDATDAIASVVIFLGASSRILPSVVRMQGAALTLKQSEGASQITLRKIEEFEINQSEILTNFPEKRNKATKSEFINVKNLCFRYPEREQFTIRNLNFSVKKGQLIAIVGESGAGKSTLADLLLGIQEPSSGLLTINGVPPRLYASENPGALAYVPQDIGILDGTVSKNVALTEEGISNPTQVIHSLQRASLWNEVQNSALNTELIVGERGMKLSGGQRQRLGIARALYTNPELIVFDEATSSLDPKTEKVVTDAIYSNQGEVTLIVIAHRLSTVKKADLVLLLDKGLLRASGNFEEVRAQAPKFDEQAKLVNL